MTSAAWLILIGLLILMAKRTSTTASTLPGLSRIYQFAEAIARAEGWYSPTYRFRALNNPGNIKGWVNGKFELLAYPKEAEGWQALYKQIEMMLTGRSQYYRADMTLEEIAKIYTGEAAYMNWARNVARSLNVSTTTTLAEVFA